MILARLLFSAQLWFLNLAAKETEIQKPRTDIVFYSVIGCISLAMADRRFWIFFLPLLPLPPPGAHLHIEAAILSNDLKGKKWAVKTEGTGR